jgi:hypothetical protein
VAIKKQEKKTLNQSSLVPTIISLIYSYYYYFTPVNQILLDIFRFLKYDIYIYIYIYIYMKMIVRSIFLF